MILLIDNYDSFSYNLYQLIGSVHPHIRVVRNDELSMEEIEELDVSHIILSPGPGRPEDAGICIEAVKYFAGKIPILGVCLGHQAICSAYGAEISYARELMHGKQSEVAAARKAMSMWTSPASTARGRPPWLRMMAGFFSLPLEMVSPILPRTPEVWASTMMPSSMYLAKIS